MKLLKKKEEEEEDDETEEGVAENYKPDNNPTWKPIANSKFKDQRTNIQAETADTIIPMNYQHKNMTSTKYKTIHLQLCAFYNWNVHTTLIMR